MPMIRCANKCRLIVLDQRRIARIGQTSGEPLEAFHPAGDLPQQLKHMFQRNDETGGLENRMFLL